LGGCRFRARFGVERPLWLDCSVEAGEPGHGMGVTISLPEEQNQQHFQDLLAKLAAAS